MTKFPIIPLWTAFLTSALLAYPVFRQLLATKSRQTIDPYAPPEHQRKQGTPTMGGIVIIVGLIAAILVHSLGWTPLVLILTFGAIGFVDDFVVPRMIKGKRGLGWKQKLVLQVVCAAGALLIGTTGEINWILLGAGVFWVLFFANAFNFADGLDGLSGGILVAYALGFAVMAFQIGDKSQFFGLSLALIGSTLPFLYLNSHPARVFMGDVGSLPIGAVLAYLNLTMFDRVEDLRIPNGHWVLLVINIILILELVLVPIQVAHFKLRKKRIFPATPIHHSFEVKGVPETKVVAWFVLTQVLLSVLAITLLAMNNNTQSGLPAVLN